MSCIFFWGNLVVKFLFVWLWNNLYTETNIWNLNTKLILHLTLSLWIIIFLISSGKGGFGIILFSSWTLWKPWFSLDRFMPSSRLRGPRPIAYTICVVPSWNNTLHFQNTLHESILNVYFIRSEFWNLSCTSYVTHYLH